MGLKHTTYIGIADAHGVESLHEKSTTTDFDRGCSFIRAQANQQRHAVYFETTLVDADMIVINGLLKEGQHETALKYIKQTGVETKVPGEQSASWDLIPDSKLDPYS
jgi:hypothetical protein